MVYGVIDGNSHRFYTYLQNVFPAIRNAQCSYNWLITDCFCNVCSNHRWSFAKCFC